MKNITTVGVLHPLGSLAIRSTVFCAVVTALHLITTPSFSTPAALHNSLSTPGSCNTLCDEFHRCVYIIGEANCGAAYGGVLSDCDQCR